MHIKQQITLFIGVILVALSIPLSFLLWEDVDAGEILIVQSPLSGNISVYTTPGPKWQGFGKVTHYKLRDQAWFMTPQKNEVLPDDAVGQPSIDIRFNDGGKAAVHGSIAYELPIDEKKLIELHKRYGSQDAVEQQVIRSSMEKCIYMSGPLMSSSESYASRRNELLGVIEDQIQNGIYKTNAKEVKTKDEATGEEKTVKQVHITLGADGKPLREQVSLLSELGIKAFNLSVKHVIYEERIENQIHKQQESSATAQQAIIEARTAEQRKITAKAEAEADQAKLVGAANAKKAESIAIAEMGVAVEALKALQIKTNAYILAQQKLEVAELGAKEAEQFKKSEQLRGEGEAARRAAVLQADNALEKKLDAWVSVQKAYAEALSKYTGQIVPSIVMGAQSSNAPTDSLQNMLQLIGVKAAKDLALDLEMSPNKNKDKKY